MKLEAKRKLNFMFQLLNLNTRQLGKLHPLMNTVWDDRKLQNITK